MKRINKQSGVAAIWFIFVIGAIMSLGALAIEGSRYIGKKARLGDALEAASIAIGANDRVTNEFKRAEKQASGRSADDVAKLWIHHYISDEESIELTKIERKDTEKLIGKNSLVTPYKLEYFRYDVQAKTTQNSWISFSNFASFDEQVQVENVGTSARIKGGHEPVDIVFVADYSGSMNKCIRGSSREYNCRHNEASKIEHLKTAITGVTERLYKINDKSTFGFVPFTKRIVTKRDGKFFCASPLLSSKNSPAENVRESGLITELLKKNTQSSRDDFYANNREVFKSVQEEAIGNYYADLIKGKYWRKNGRWNANFEYENYVKSVGLRWSNIRHKGSRYFPRDQLRGAYKFDAPLNKEFVWKRRLIEDQVDIHRSANEILIRDKPMYPLSIAYERNTKTYAPKLSSYCTSMAGSGMPNFYSIDRDEFNSETELAAFNTKVRNMRAGGGTDMYQGLLAAPDQFFGAKNPNRYIIVLSDGKENNHTFKGLVDANLCENLKSTLSKEGQDEKYNFKLFVVGIGLNQNNNYAYKKCFKDNIITVWDPAELEKRILGIITDDMGHNFERQ